MTSILRPKALRPGDLVAVVAPSSGLEKDEAPLLERGVETLERMGFVVRVSPLVDLDRSWWWAAAPPAEVAEDLNRHLRDPEVRAIFSLTGGRMTLSYLDLIDVEAVRADPKPVLGMSDISALHLALHARTGLVALHSDLVTFGFGEWNEVDDARRDQLAELYRRVLTEDAPLGPLPAGSRWESWRSGRAEGPLIGGMLNRLVRVQATSSALSPGAIRRRDPILGGGLHVDVGGLERPPRAATGGGAGPDLGHGRGQAVRGGSDAARTRLAPRHRPRGRGRS